jgi:SagB-type dehydrogenase family enzyme
MRIDRRGFIRALGSALPLLAGRAHARREPGLLAPEIHHLTRNTRFGTIGKKRPAGPRTPPFKRYPGAARYGLPRALPASQGGTLENAIRANPAAGFAAEELSSETVSRLLFLSNGVTSPSALGGGGSTRLRAAPSAGALYAGEVYLAAERVSGLARGLYYYAVASHRLIALHEGPVVAQIAQALERPETIEGAAVVVLLSNVFGRYTRQYANRGYRYALIDSGHIGENLRLAASSAELAVVSPNRFVDDDINGLLDLDGVTEAVCALHAIAPSGGRAQGSRAARPALVEKQHSAAPLPSEPITERFHEATKLVRSDSPRANAKHAVIAPREGQTVPLPKPVSSTMTLDAAVRQRRSAERFSEKPLELVQLATVLMAAKGHAGSARAADVTLFAVAHRVQGLSSGVYRYADPQHELRLWRRGAFESDMVSACLGQSKAGSAAAGLVMVAPFGRQTLRLGEREYRDALIEAGAAGQRIYLAAEAAGLAARNLAAFIDQRFNELLGLPEGWYALHLTMLGNGN